MYLKDLLFLTFILFLLNIYLTKGIYDFQRFFLSIPELYLLGQNTTTANGTVATTTTTTSKIELHFQIQISFYSIQTHHQQHYARKVTIIVYQ